jgi:hypothetical protein
MCQFFAAEQLALIDQASHAAGRGECNNRRTEAIDLLKEIFFLPRSPSSCSSSVVYLYGEYISAYIVT